MNTFHIRFLNSLDKIKNLIFCIPLFFVVTGYGQNEPRNIIPLSPNAGAITKYGEIPVNNYTGIPQISIPIYTIRSGELELCLLLE